MLSRQAAHSEPVNALRAYFLPHTPTGATTILRLLPSSNRHKTQMVTDQDNLFLR